MAGHIVYVHTIVPASPQAVWDVITDVGSADRVFRSVDGSRRLGSGPFGVGTAWQQRRTVFGHHGTEELRVVECEAPRLLVVETRLGHDVVRTSYRLSEIGENGGRTRVAATTILRTDDRTPLERFAWDNFGEGRYERTHKMLERDLEDIAAEVGRRARVAV
ncbi:MAG TPA: SRPBCC family protein [Nocardioides sp.]|nr:SRPBCC family protein [Nocardioides sp.]